MLGITSKLKPDGALSPEINLAYKYRGNDVDKILTARVHEENLQEDTIIMPAINDSSQFRAYLEMISSGIDKSIVVNQKIIIPCNIDRGHWIGVLIELNEASQCIRALYVDSMPAIAGAGVGLDTNAGVSFMQALQNEFVKIYPEMRLSEYNDIFYQNDIANSGPWTIENLILAIKNREKLEGDSGSIELVRHKQLEALQKYINTKVSEADQVLWRDYYDAFLKKQKISTINPKESTSDEKDSDDSDNYKSVLLKIKNINIYESDKEFTPKILQILANDIESNNFEETSRALKTSILPDIKWLTEIVQSAANVYAKELPWSERWTIAMHFASRLCGMDIVRLSTEPMEEREDKNWLEIYRMQLIWLLKSDTLAGSKIKKYEGFNSLIFFAIRIASMLQILLEVYSGAMKNDELKNAFKDKAPTKEMASDKSQLIEGLLNEIVRDLVVFRIIRFGGLIEINIEDPEKKQDLCECFINGIALGLDQLKVNDSLVIPLVFGVFGENNSNKDSRHIIYLQVDHTHIGYELYIHNYGYGSEYTDEDKSRHHKTSDGKIHPYFVGILKHDREDTWQANPSRLNTKYSYLKEILLASFKHTKEVDAFYKRPEEIDELIFMPAAEEQPPNSCVSYGYACTNHGITFDKYGNHWQSWLTEQESKQLENLFEEIMPTDGSGCCISKEGIKEFTDTYTYLPKTRDGEKYWHLVSMQKLTKTDKVGIAGVEISPLPKSENLEHANLTTGVDKGDESSSVRKLEMLPEESRVRKEGNTDNKVIGATTFGDIIGQVKFEGDSNDEDAETTSTCSNL